MNAICSRKRKNQNVSFFVDYQIHENSLIKKRMGLNELAKVAAQRGYVEDLQTRVTAENINDVDELQNTLLHIASGAGHEAVVEFLLNKKDLIKPSLNKKNHIGDTPLHKAAFRGYKEVIKMLLKNGCDSKVQNRDGKIPVDLVRDDGIKTLFPEYREDIQIEDDDD